MEFKVGDKIIITDRPGLWDSHLKDRYPLNEVIFPYRCTIKEICKRPGAIAMTDGIYGWSLDILIKEKKIKKIPISEIRRKKLKKLNKISKIKNGKTY